MKTTKRINEIIHLQSKLISKEWAERTKEAILAVQKMKKRQQSLSLEEARKEAMEQARKIRNQRQNRV